MISVSTLAGVAGYDGDAGFQAEAADLVDGAVQVDVFQ